MIAISCKNGRAFCGINEDYFGAEEELQIAYYKAQGCLIKTVESIKFEPCECEHCAKLEHRFEMLIDTIIDQNTD